MNNLLNYPSHEINKYKEIIRQNSSNLPYICPNPQEAQKELTAIIKLITRYNRMPIDLEDASYITILNHLHQSATCGAILRQLKLKTVSKYFGYSENAKFKVLAFKEYINNQVFMHKNNTNKDNNNKNNANAQKYATSLVVKSKVKDNNANEQNYSISNYLKIYQKNYKSSIANLNLNPDDQQKISNSFSNVYKTLNQVINEYKQKKLTKNQPYLVDKDYKKIIDILFCKHDTSYILNLLGIKSITPLSIYSNKRAICKIQALQIFLNANKTNHKEIKQNHAKSFIQTPKKDPLKTSLDYSINSNSNKDIRLSNLSILTTTHNNNKSNDEQGSNLSFSFNPNKYRQRDNSITLSINNHHSEQIINFDNKEIFVEFMNEKSENEPEILDKYQNFLKNCDSDGYSYTMLEEYPHKNIYFDVNENNFKLRDDSPLEKSTIPKELAEQLEDVDNNFTRVFALQPHNASHVSNAYEAPKKEIKVLRNQMADMIIADQKNFLNYLNPFRAEILLNFEAVTDDNYDCIWATNEKTQQSSSLGNLAKLLRKEVFKNCSSKASLIKQINDDTQMKTAFPNLVDLLVRDEKSFNIFTNQFMAKKFCNKLNINYDETITCKNNHYYLKGENPHDIKADGNCFFHCISKIKINKS